MRTEPCKRARATWKLGDPLGALSELSTDGPALTDDVRVLATDIARSVRAVDRILGDLDRLELVAGERASAPRTQRIHADVQKLLGHEQPPEIAAERCARHGQGLHPHHYVVQPNSAEEMQGLYARAGWIAIELGRNGSDLWWRRRLIPVPLGHHPAWTLLPPALGRFRETLQRNPPSHVLRRFVRDVLQRFFRDVLPRFFHDVLPRFLRALARCAVTQLHALAWAVRGVTPPGLRRHIKGPLAPVLRLFGMGPAAQ